MRVLLDATAIPADLGGVGRYVVELVPELVAAGVDLTVVTRPDLVELLGPQTAGADVVLAGRSTLHRPVRFVWEQVGLPDVARRSGVDVLLSPHYTMPWRSPVPVVVTVHDATFFSHPELHSPIKAWFFRAATRRAVQNAASVVVPSTATARELARYVRVDPEHVHVAPHGVDRTQFHPVDDAERARVRATLGLGDADYVAFLGTLEPRKNVPALIEAWVAACDRRPSPPALVLAGSPGWDEKVKQTLAVVPEHLRVVRPGYVPLADVPGLLSGAAVFVYASKGEGFGLPVLEAMACGAAVLTTQETSLPEVGGDAVSYTGTSADSIRDELVALLDDEPRRLELSARALQRSAQFTWAASARAHIAALESAVSRR